MSAALRPSTGDVFTVPLPEKEYPAFTPAKDGLPVFHGETFEEHVEAWKHVTESVECRFWALAAIVASLQRKRGDAAVVEFSKEVSVSKSKLYSMAKTYRAFEDSKRLENRSFHLHTVAAEADDPVLALNTAVGKGWSTRQLQRWVDTGLEPGEKSDINSTALAITIEASEAETPVPISDMKALADREFRSFLTGFLSIVQEQKLKCPNPKFVSDVMDYIEEEINEYLEQLVLDTLKEKVVSAWNNGRHQENEIAAATGIPMDEIHSVMKAYAREGLFEKIKRAKTSMAKGTPPWKWHLVGQPIGSDFERPV